MEIVFHIGAHKCGGRDLTRSLLKHRDALMSEGIAVPGPSRYRELIGQAVNTLRGDPAPPLTTETILGAALDSDDAERIVFSNESFICMPIRALDDGVLYARAFKTEWLRNVFPGHRAAFAVAIRNPAMFLSEAYKTFSANGINWAKATQGMDLPGLRWSEFILRLRRINPDCPITVWTYEDTPLTWPEVIREVSGHDPFTRLDVSTDILAHIMRRDGVRRLRAFLEQRPVETEQARRRVVTAFLDRYHVPHRVEEAIEVPGWTDADTDRADACYDDDLARIAAIPGVRLITA